MLPQLLLIFPFLWVLTALIGPPSAWERTRFSLLERLVFRAALGMGLLSYAVLGIGLLGFLTPAAIGVVLGLFFVVSLPGQVALIREIASRKREPSADSGSRRLDGLGWALVALIGILVLLTAFGCATPPTGVDWDGLSYHLADPKLYLKAGRIVFIPWEHHSNFPALVEMLFTIGLAFHSVVLAKAFHWAMGLLTAAGLAAAYLRLREMSPPGENALTGKHSPATLALIPAALFLGAPHVLWEATVAYIDLGATLYAFLGVYAFTLGMHRKPEEAGDRGRWLLLSGVMTGFAIGCKTTNGLFFILLTLWALWAGLNSNEKGRDFAQYLTRFALPAAIVACPWFLKTWLWTGNPVYPFLYSVFGGVNWNAELAKNYSLEQAQFGMGSGPLALLTLPWNLTFHSENFAKGMPQFTAFGPFYLAFLPLLAFVRPLPKWVKSWLLLTFGFGVIWVVLTQQIRYLLPILPLFCLMATFVVERIPAGRMGRIGIGAFFLFALALTAFRGYEYEAVSLPMIPTALGSLPPEAFLDHTFELYPALQFINGTLPQNAKILLIEETRGYGLDRDYMWGNPGHHTLIPWETFHTPAEMARWLRTHGFTHLLLNTRWMRPGWGSSAWEALIKTGSQDGTLQQVFTQRNVLVFEIH